MRPNPLHTFHLHVFDDPRLYRAARCPRHRHRCCRGVVRSALRLRESLRRDRRHRLPPACRPSRSGWDIETHDVHSRLRNRPKTGPRRPPADAQRRLGQQPAKALVSRRPPPRRVRLEDLRLRTRYCWPAPCRLLVLPGLPPSTPCPCAQ